MTRTGGGTANGGTGGTGGTGGSAGSLADSGRASKGSKGTGSRETSEVGAGYLCTFLVAGQRFALSTALVRELVEVTALTLVPRTDDALLGLFNLRGEPMPLVDMAMILGTGRSVRAAKMPVIIMRSEGMSLGARIDALGNVVPNASLAVNTDPNPLLLGYLPPSATAGPTAVINPVEFLNRLGRLKRTSSERE